MSEKEAILILKSGSCSWRGCMFCGYGRITGHKPTKENLERQFNDFFSKLEKGVDTVKVFGSGSFLDEEQVPKEMRKRFIENCREKKIKKVVIETRPEHITKQKLGEFKNLELTVALGLEVADDQLLDRINKGFHLGDYEKAVEAIKKACFKVRTYLLVNIPGEKEDTLDKSVEYSLEHSDSVVLINLLPHGNTPLFKMWVNGEWNYLNREEFTKKTEKWVNNPKVELDVETFRFTPYFPAELKKPLSGIGEEYLTHPYFEVWQDYLLRWYNPQKGRILLILPCSRKKPYAESETHKKIISALEETGTRRLFHEVMVSNPGVIPREFENKYPFNNYDWDERLETEEIKKRYIEVTERRIEAYLKTRREYIKQVYCYLKPDSESYKALENACKKTKKELINLLSKGTYEKIKNTKKPLQNPEALENMKEKLRWLRQNST